jgi:arylformamidase
VRIIDISVTTGPSTPEWPGDTPFSCGWAWDMTAGASVNVSSVTMSPHVGTHADAPLHVTIGAAGADQLPLEAFSGPALVVDVQQLDGDISHDALRQLFGNVHPVRLLLKSGRSIARGIFPERWPALTPECANQLVRDGLRLLGVDAPSVDDRESKTLSVHHTLFGGGAQLLENLDLSAVQPGLYELVAFPAKFAGLDAAPVRAVLVQRDETTR